MRSISLFRNTAAALLASTALAQPAFAQEAGETATDEIVVTANKREQNLQDVAAAVSAIGTEKLDQLQVSELQDVTKFLPSVTIQTAVPGFSQVYFRGVASGENANHSASLPTVGTYLDEMPITTIQGALDIHAYDLSRVEALAGPQGTLYGASSMAGTIKLVSNAPDTTSTYGGAGLELNTVKSGGIGGVAEGFVNARLSDSAALRVVGWYRHDAGYIDNIRGTRTYPTSGAVADNADLVEDDYNEVDTYGARAALAIDLNDSWTIKPTLMGQIQKYKGSFAQERSSANSSRYQTVQYNPESGEDKWLQAAMTIQGKLGDWDLVATGGQLWREAEGESDYSDYAFFYDAVADSGDAFYDNTGAPINPNQYIQSKDKYGRQFGEIRLSSPQDKSLRLIGGLFYQRQKHNIEQNYIIDNIADALTIPGTDSNIWLTKQIRIDRDTAAFGEVSYDLTDRLTLTGGGRVYKYKNSLEGYFGLISGFSRCIRPEAIAGAPCTNVDKVTSDTDSIFKVNATYKFNDDALVYATWSQGFRPGGINRRGTLPPYASDSLDNYELGWKTQFGAIRFNGAIYQQDWKDIQLSFLGQNGLTEIRSAGVARIRGAEVDLGYRYGGFTLNLGGTYNNAEIRKDFCQVSNAAFDCTTTGNSLLAPAGTKLPVTAKFKGNAVARQEFPIGSYDGHLQLAVSHIGKRRNDLRTAENEILGNLKGYTTLDISVGMKTDTLSFELFGTNLFNKNGVINSGVQCPETVCGDPENVSATGGVFYENVIKPRIIGLKVSTEF